MADLDYAQSCIAGIQARLGKMTKDEIMQALEVVRVSLVPDVTLWTEPERPDAPGYEELDCGLPPGSFNK
jgi:hypothetical protein